MGGIPSGRRGVLNPGVGVRILLTKSVHRGRESSPVGATATDTRHRGPDFHLYCVTPVYFSFMAQTLHWAAGRSVVCIVREGKSERTDPGGDSEAARVRPRY